MGNERRQRPFILRWRSSVLNSAEPSSVKLSLLALAEFANPDGSGAIPGFPKLAAMTSQSEKTCRRAFDEVDGRWFTRRPVKLSGKNWRAYEYALKLPEGADTTTARNREGADTTTGPDAGRCGHLEPKVRTFEPEGADTVSTVLGRAPRKSTKEEKQASPPKGSKRKTKSRITYPEWAEAKHSDDVLIPPEHHVFRYAEKVGIPDDFLDLAWRCFRERYQNDERTTYADWGQTFRNAVEGNWYGLWWIDSEGQYVLTTKGKQADIFHQTKIQHSSTRQPSTLPELEA